MDQRFRVVFEGKALGGKLFDRMAFKKRNAICFFIDLRLK